MTCRMILTSQTCAHDDPASPAPSRPAPHWRHCARRARPLPARPGPDPGRPFTGMPGLPARLAVLAPLPLRGLPLALPRLPALPRPDRLLRRRRARIGAVHPQPPLQLGDPQFQPPPQLPLRLQVRAHRGKPLPQRGELSVLGLDHRAQPRDQLTLLSGRTGQIGHFDTSPKLARPELEVQTPSGHGVSDGPPSLSRSRREWTPPMTPAAQLGLQRRNRVLTATRSSLKTVYAGQTGPETINVHGIFTTRRRC